MSRRDAVLRLARKGDIGSIVRLLADDVLGREREDLSEPLPASYLDAFEAIEADPNQELIVAEANGIIVGTLQLTFLPHLTHRGSWRAQIEGVRVAGEQRGSGIGREMVSWAIARAHQRGCKLVQLTTDRQRPDALRFYEDLGFKATHHGLKLVLDT